MEENIVIIYGRTEPYCAECVRAKKIAEKSNIEFIFKDLTNKEWDIVELSKLLNMRITSVPVITFNNKLIVGGCEGFSKFLRQNSF
jgi:glutaredoxin